MSHTPRRTELSLAEAGVLVLLCFGLFIWGSLQSVLAGFPSHPFRDGEVLGMVAVELVLAALAVLYLAQRGYDLPSLWPEPTWRDSGLGLGLVLLTWVASSLATWPWRDLSDQPIDIMVSASSLSTEATVLMAMVNGTYEEVFLLAGLMRGLRRFGLSVAVGVPLLVRLSYHLYQGPAGAASILAFGLVLAAAYARTGRLWAPVLAHILCDILPFV